MILTPCPYDPIRPLIANGRYDLLQLDKIINLSDTSTLGHTTGTQGRANGNRDTGDTGEGLFGYKCTQQGWLYI